MKDKPENFVLNKETLMPIELSAVLNKMVSLGFRKQGPDDWYQDEEYKYIGPSGSQIDLCNKNTGKEEITLPELMFCDQSDEVTHCYFSATKELVYSPCKLDCRNDFLICTREAKPEQSWHEKGGLPPVGEVVELVSIGMTIFNKEVSLTYIGGGVGCYREIKSGMEFTFDPKQTVFRPIKSERDKAIISACEIVDKDRAKSNINVDCSYAQKCAIEALVDAGWRPSND